MNYKPAIASYDAAIQHQPSLAEAWNNRGLALGNLGDYQSVVSSGACQV
ncbi:MAG: tetratricopeptide repeat protein [Coleofasciculus sp. D1-CHI-01]